MSEIKSRMVVKTKGKRDHILRTCNHEFPLWMWFSGKIDIIIPSYFWG